MIFLHLESFENKLVNQISRYSWNSVFMVKPPQKGEIFLHGYDIFFFLDSCFFPYTKKLLKVSDHSVEEIQHESTTLTWLTNRLIVVLFQDSFSECDQLFDAVSEKDKCIQHIVCGDCRHNLNKSNI